MSLVKSLSKIIKPSDWTQNNNVYVTTIDISSMRIDSTDVSIYSSSSLDIKTSVSSIDGIAQIVTLSIIELPTVNVPIDISAVFKISDGSDKGDKGDPGKDGKDGISAYEIAVENGFTGTQTEWLLSLIGPKGNTGTAATIEIGTVTTGDKVGVSNSGSPLNAVLNFVLPTPGAPIKGDPGKDGKAGLSAYEVAKQNGFTGTEAEWTAASINTVNSIKVNNIAITPDADKSVNIDLAEYAKKSDIVNTYKFKGSVDTYAALPTTAEVGDVYNISTGDADHGIKAGDNVSWTGKDWDNLSGFTDMSAYYTAAKVDGKLTNYVKTANLDSVTVGHATAAATATSDAAGNEITKTYATVTAVNSISNTVNSNNSSANTRLTALETSYAGSKITGTVPAANTANTANTANSANTANTANTAGTANYANTAGTATTALNIPTSAGQGNIWIA